MVLQLSFLHYFFCVLFETKTLFLQLAKNFRREKRNIGHEYDVCSFPLFWLIVFWALITKFGYFIYFLTASLFLEFILERTNILMTKQFLFATFGRDILSHYSFVFFVQTFFLKVQKIELASDAKKRYFWEYINLSK